MTTPRTELEFSLTTEEFGKRNFKLVDKLMVEDLVVHLAKREMFRVITGIDEGVDVNREFKDALVLDDFIVGS